MKPKVPEASAYRVEPSWNTRHQDEVKTLFPHLVEAARIPKSWQRFMDWHLFGRNGGETFEHVQAVLDGLHGEGVKDGSWPRVGECSGTVYYRQRGDGGWCSALVAVSGIFRRKMWSVDGGDGARDGGAAFQVTVVEFWGRESVLADSAGDALGTGWADGTRRGDGWKKYDSRCLVVLAGFRREATEAVFGRGAAEGRKPVFSGVLEAMVQVELEVRGGVIEFVPPKWRWTAASSQVG